MNNPSSRTLAEILNDSDGWTYGPGLRQLRSVPAGSDGRCLDGCLSEEAAFHRANPGSGRELGDGAAMHCYSCGLSVCLGCGTVPAPLQGWICDDCGDPAGVTPV